MGERVDQDNTDLALWRDENKSQGLDNLIRRYERDVFAFILYQSTCDWNEAYEAAANCMAKVLRDLRSSGEGSLPVAVFRHALNVSRDVKSAPLFNPVQFLSVDDVRKKILRTARRALTMLPPEQRAMLLQRDQANLPYADIAAILDVSEQEIKEKTWQARDVFRGKVDEVINRDRGGQT